MKGSVIVFALIIINGSSFAQDEGIGRLFHTPEKRTALDHQRERGITPLTTESSVPLTLNGQVIRSSGRNTTWVNGTPVEGRDAQNLLRAPLRPGETAYGRDQQDTRDLLNGGTIVVKPPRALP